MSSSAVAFLPRWTKRVSIEEGSRDPLGLSRVSGMVTDFLLQGIITQTYRARYYSFYCWAIWHIDTEETATQYERDKSSLGSILEEIKIDIASPFISFDMAVAVEPETRITIENIVQGLSHRNVRECSSHRWLVGSSIAREADHVV